MPSKEAKIIEIVGGHAPYLHKDVGIEIELESYSKPFPSPPVGWLYFGDGSLHADYSVEYVTSEPINIEDVDKELDKLKNILDFDNIYESIRTGVHVHVNCLDLTIKEVITFILVYLSMERILVKFCGPNRDGNHFCLKSSDAGYLIFTIGKLIESNNLNVVATNDIRYSSINLNSLIKFGTLEFRAMQTYKNLDKIEEWCNILYNIKKYSKGVNNNKEIAESISHMSPGMWVRSVVGEKYYDMIKYEGLDEDVMKDVRNIQEIIYR